MKKTYRERNIILLSSIFIASLVTANLIASKLVVICGVELSAGVLVIPVTFLMTDLLSELYGKKIATYTVLIGLAIQIYVLLLIWLGDILPAAPRRDLTGVYRQMFALTPRIVIASITAYFFSQFIDVRIYHLFKKITNGKHLWIRNNGSTIISQFIDTFVFVSIFFAGVLPFSAWIKTSLAMYGVKVIMALCDTPFIYIGTYLLREEASDEWA